MALTTTSLSHPVVECHRGSKCSKQVHMTIHPYLTEKECVIQLIDKYSICDGALPQFKVDFKYVFGK